jgi:hypothetical protein
VARTAAYVEFFDAGRGRRLPRRVGLNGEDPPHIALWELDGRPTLFVGQGERVHYVDVGSGDRIWPPLPWPGEVSALLPARLDDRELLFVADDIDIGILDARTGEVLSG